MRSAAGLIGALGIAAGLSACAAPPESIAQSNVGPISYNSLNCSDLAGELERVEEATTQASQQQEPAQDSDPTSGVSVAPQLTNPEEELQAIRLAMAHKPCPVMMDVERVTSWRSKD